MAKSSQLEAIKPATQINLRRVPASKWRFVELYNIFDLRTAPRASH